MFIKSPKLRSKHVERKEPVELSVAAENMARKVIISPLLLISSLFFNYLLLNNNNIIIINRYLLEWIRITMDF